MEKVLKESLLRGMNMGFPRMGYQEDGRNSLLEKEKSIRRRDGKQEKAEKRHNGLLGENSLTEKKRPLAPGACIVRPLQDPGKQQKQEADRKA